MLEEILTTILAGVAVLILWGIRRPIWRMILKLIWRIRRWWANNRHANQVRLNEAVVLTNGEIRHRDCVRRGEEIDEREQGTYMPLGPCTVCGAHGRSPRNKPGSYR